MSVTFYVVDPALAPELEKLVDEMEQEDVLEDVENSAYDRFATTLAKAYRWALELDDDAGEPAESFYEWFHDRISQHFDKLFLTAQESQKALGTLEKLKAKQGLDKLLAGFWGPHDPYSRETAAAYLEHATVALQQAVSHNGLMVICYR